MVALATGSLSQVTLKGAPRGIGSTGSRCVDGAPWSHRALCSGRGGTHGHVEEAEPSSLLQVPACLASAQLPGPGVKEEALDRLKGGMTKPDRRSSLGLPALCGAFGRHEQLHPGFGQCCAEFCGGSLVREEAVCDR